MAVEKNINTSISKMLYFVVTSYQVGNKNLLRMIWKKEMNCNLKVETIRCLVFRCEKDVVHIISKQGWRRQPFQLGCES